MIVGINQMLLPRGLRVVDKSNFHPECEYAEVISVKLISIPTAQHEIRHA